MQPLNGLTLLTTILKWIFDPVGKLLRFLFTTRVGWILVVAVAIGAYGLYLRNISPNQMLAESQGIPEKILPWNGAFFQDWMSPEQFPTTTDGLEWKVTIELNGDKVTFTYHIRDDKGWKKFEKYEYENGETYETNRGTVTFQFDDLSWSFK